MSQIPRRSTLSLTQAPKPRRTPIFSPAASQPMLSKQPEGDSPRTAPKIIDVVDTPIVADDGNFGDSIANTDLIKILSNAEEKNSPKAVEKTAEKAPINASPKTPITSAPTTKEAKPNPASPPKSAVVVLTDCVQDASGDGSTSIRSSVDSAAPVEMDSLLIPDDDEVLANAAATAAKEKNTSASFDSPRPNKTPGKVLHLAKGHRISPFRKASEQQLDNVSTIVNLSTVSEQSVEGLLDSPAVGGGAATKNAARNGAGDEKKQEAAATTPDSGAAKTSEGEKGNGDSVEATGGSTRRISARRAYTSTSRPLREMSFRNATREAYKRVGGGGGGEGSDENSNEAGANDSVNATVGSELGFNMDDLPETPAAGVKRRRDSSDAEDETEAPEAKKGFFQQYCAIM